MRRTNGIASREVASSGSEFDDEMTRARAELIDAIERDDVRTTKALWRRFEAGAVDPFELELEVDREGVEFDGHPCDWALESRAWRVLAHLLRMGMRKCDANAEEIFGAVATGVDSCPESGELVERWKEVMIEAIRPTTPRQAHALMNDTRLWELGPIAKAACIGSAIKFLCDDERAELDLAARRPATTGNRLGPARL